MLETSSEYLQDSHTVSQKTPSMIKFGWHKLESGPLVQYIYRGDEKYVAFSLLDKNVTPPELLDFSLEVFNCLPRFTITMTTDEAAAFNNINVRYCDRQFMGNHSLAEGDPMIRLEDVDKVITFYRSCSLLVVKRQVNHLFGFIRIAGEQLVPFIRYDKIKLVPMFYFDGQSQFLEERSVDVRDEWMLAGFRFCCLLQKIRKEFYEVTSVRMIDLEHVKTLFPANTTFQMDFPTSVNEKVFSGMFIMARKANKVEAHNSKILNNTSNNKSSFANPLLQESITTPRDSFSLENRKTNANKSSVNSPLFQQRLPTSNQFFVNNTRKFGGSVSNVSPNVTLVKYNNTTPNKNSLKGTLHQDLMNRNFEHHAPQTCTSQNQRYEQYLANLSRDQIHSVVQNQNSLNNLLIQYHLNGVQHPSNSNVRYSRLPSSHNDLSNTQFSNNKSTNPLFSITNHVTSPSNRYQVQYPMNNIPYPVSQTPAQKSLLLERSPPVQNPLERVNCSEILKYLLLTSTNRIPSNIESDKNITSNATRTTPLNIIKNHNSTSALPNNQANHLTQSPSNIDMLEINSLSMSTFQNNNRKDASTPVAGRNSLEILEILNDSSPAVLDNSESASNVTVSVLPTPGNKRPISTNVIVNNKKTKTEVSCESNIPNQTNPVSLRTNVNPPRQQQSFNVSDRSSSAVTNVPYKSPLAGSSPIHRQPSPFMLEANTGRISSAVPNAQFYGHLNSSHCESGRSTPNWPICYKMKGECFCQCPKCDMRQN